MDRQELSCVIVEVASFTAVDRGEAASSGQAADDAHGAAGALVRHGAQRAAAVGAGVRRPRHQVRAARQEPVQLRHALPRAGAALRRRCTLDTTTHRSFK